tara:strand:+ start:2100 stop:2714 length:615 start_codon:yes stop_codon:yes gene_type:complete
MLNNKQLIIFAAPSGSGKSSLIKKIIESSNNRIQLSVSATTRSPREGEINGKDYFFISDEEFKSLQENDAFIESAEVHGFMYGTLKSFVKEKIDEDITVILDIDVQGFRQIKDSLVSYVSIFIIPPSIEELRDRLISRGLDTKEVIEQRLVNAKNELKFANLFDYIILNDNFEEAFNQIFSIIFQKNIQYNKDLSLNKLDDLLD